MTAPPRTCQGCGSRPVARKTLRFCYDCLPGGPRIPPPCKRCGSAEDYYTAGVCRWCYRGAAVQPAGSCPDCLAWGTTRQRAWLCHACAAWRAQHPVTGDCAVCGHRRHLGRGPYCRLCWRTAADYHYAHRRDGGTYLPLDVQAASRHGQQLFFADFTRAARRRRPPRSTACGSAPGAPSKPDAPPAARRRPRYRQLTLFDNNPPGFTARHGIPAPASFRLAADLDTLACELAAQRGWSHTSLKRTRLAIRVVLGQHSGTSPVRASDLGALTGLGIHAVSLVRAVLAEAGLLEDDQPPAIQRWFTARTAGLPAGIRGELGTWFDIMRHGSSAPPRRRARADVTTRLQLRHALPAIRGWAADGHQSLREISRQDILAALPPPGDQRILVISALRSIFTVLHGRKLTFHNPAARIRPGRVPPGQPVPARTEVIRAALHSSDPARAALTALFAFYALLPRQVRQLKLTDLRDRHLHIGERILPVPPAVHDRLSGYLAYRAARWPASLNPHLFINMQTAGHLTPVGPYWFARILKIAPSLLREDRILDEANASPGDVRRICDLFGMTVKAALRYTSAIEHPDLTTSE